MSKDVGSDHRHVIFIIIPMFRSHIYQSVKLLAHIRYQVLDALTQNSNTHFDTLELGLEGEKSRHPDPYLKT